MAEPRSKYKAFPQRAAGRTTRSITRSRGTAFASHAAQPPEGILPFDNRNHSQLNERKDHMRQTRTPSPDPDEAIRERILSRAKTVNAEILDRLRLAADDLEAGEHRAALGALDGIEAQLTIIRSVLLLLS
jgi:hypothetical protein